MLNEQDLKMYDKDVTLRAIGHDAFLDFTRGFSIPISFVPYAGQLAGPGYDLIKSVMDHSLGDHIKSQLQKYSDKFNDQTYDNFEQAVVGTNIVEHLLKFQEGLELDSQHAQMYTAAGMSIFKDLLKNNAHDMKQVKIRLSELTGLNSNVSDVKKSLEDLGKEWKKDSNGFKIKIDELSGKILNLNSKLLEDNKLIINLYSDFTKLVQEGKEKEKIDAAKKAYEAAVADREKELKGKVDDFKKDLANTNDGFQAVSFAALICGDAETAQKISTIGSASTTIAKAMWSLVNPSLVASAGMGIMTPIGPYIMIAQAAFTIFSAFKSKKPEPNPFAPMYEFLKKLSSQIADFEKHMHERFNRLDKMVIDIHITLIKNFSQIHEKLNTIDTNLTNFYDAIQNTINNIQQHLSKIDKDAFIYFKKIYSQEYENAKYYSFQWHEHFSNPLPLGDYRKYCLMFAKFADVDSVAGEMNGTEFYEPTTKIVSQELQKKAPEYNIGFLSMLLRDPSFGINLETLERVPNPNIWAEGAYAYMGLIHRTTEHRNNIPSVKGLENLINRGQEIKAFIMQVRNNPQTLLKPLTQYRDHIIKLIDDLKKIKNDYINNKIINPAKEKIAHEIGNIQNAPKLQIPKNIKMTCNSFKPDDDREIKELPYDYLPGQNSYAKKGFEKIAEETNENSITSLRDRINKMQFPFDFDITLQRLETSNQNTCLIPILKKKDKLEEGDFEIKCNYYYPQLLPAYVYLAELLGAGEIKLIYTISQNKFIIDTFFQRQNEQILLSSFSSHNGPGDEILEDIPSKIDINCYGELFGVNSNGYVFRWINSLWRREPLNGIPSSETISHIAVGSNTFSQSNHNYWLFVLTSPEVNDHGFKIYSYLNNEWINVPGIFKTISAGEQIFAGTNNNAAGNVYYSFMQNGAHLQIDSVTTLMNISVSNRSISKVWGTNNGHLYRRKFPTLPTPPQAGVYSQSEWEEVTVNGKALIVSTGADKDGNNSIELVISQEGYLLKYKQNNWIRLHRHNITDNEDRYKTVAAGKDFPGCVAAIDISGNILLLKQIKDSNIEWEVIAQPKDSCTFNKRLGYLTKAKQNWELIMPSAIKQAPQNILSNSDWQQTMSKQDQTSSHTKVKNICQLALYAHAKQLAGQSGGKDGEMLLGLKGNSETLDNISCYYSIIITLIKLCFKDYINLNYLLKMLVLNIDGFRLYHGDDIIKMLVEYDPTIPENYILYKLETLLKIIDSVNNLIIEIAADIKNKKDVCGHPLVDGTLSDLNKFKNNYYPSSSLPYVSSTTVSSPMMLTVLTDSPIHNFNSDELQNSLSRITPGKKWSIYSRGAEAILELNNLNEATEILNHFKANNYFDIKLKYKMNTEIPVISIKYPNIEKLKRMPPIPIVTNNNPTLTV